MRVSVFAVDNPTEADRVRALQSRVWLDGVEVTHSCQIAIVDEPDEAGAVLLLKRNANGRVYVDPETGDVAKEWRYGVVMIQQPESP